MIDIADRPIGGAAPCFIIAEAGVNHNGDMALARRLVEAAAQQGADAVKFQTFRADRLASARTPTAAYQRRGGHAGQSQREMLRRLELSEVQHIELMERCRAAGLTFLSSPFDEESADLLERLGVAAFKIPSGELTNLGFLAHVARKGKPMLVSTGMATLEETRQAVEVIRAVGNLRLALLQCVSRYPADPSDANLRAMATLAQAFGAPVGYSDHTPGVDVALAAAALGACVIEKHLTIDRRLPGPDHQASLEPEEFGRMVRGIRTVQSALGHGRKEPAAGEAEIARVARKSLVTTRAVAAGAELTREAVAARRPGTGLPPSALERVLGRRAAVAIPAETLLTWEMLRD